MLVCPNCGYRIEEKRDLAVSCGDCHHVSTIYSWQDNCVCWCGRIISRELAQKCEAKELYKSLNVSSFLFKYGVRS